MPHKQLALERLGSLYDVYGSNASSYFQKCLIRAVFLLQNTTSENCTKEQITEVTTAIEEIFNVFDTEEVVV